MKLMTAELERRFAEVASQGIEKDPVIIARFFDPVGRRTWYATEYQPVIKAFFGFVSTNGNRNDEWCFFFLAKLEAYTGPLGLGIERDLYWTETKASAVMR